MRVTIGDDVYQLDMSQLRIKELRALKRQSGLTIAGFTNGLAESDPDAVTALVWLAKLRAGEIVRYEDIDFDLGEFDVDLEEEPEPAAEAGPEADATPTQGDDAAS